ncbi:MAG: hypothetical protein WD096_02015 [Actinomycetota bacterium]
MWPIVVLAGAWSLVSCRMVVLRRRAIGELGEDPRVGSLRRPWNRSYGALRAAAVLSGLVFLVTLGFALAGR